MPPPVAVALSARAASFFRKIGIHVILPPSVKSGDDHPRRRKKSAAEISLSRETNSAALLKYLNIMALKGKAHGRGASGSAQNAAF
jgi:hypothetical protein